MGDGGKYLSSLSLVVSRFLLSSYRLNSLHLRKKNLVFTSSCEGEKWLQEMQWAAGCDQASQKVACANSFSRKHLKIQEEDMNGLMVGGAEKKKRVSRIAGGGLRQFSLIVCKKLEMKGRTTYSEVADEIIAELAAPDVNPVPLNEFDEKNIRRRVYDALNVLMAMDIIAKDKKEIQWKGFPRTSPDDIKELEALRLGLMSRIEKKASYLHDLQEQIAGLQNLMLRNQQLHKSGAIAARGIGLPFILVRTRREATVEIEISEDTQLVHFDFNGTPFSLLDEVSVLKAMRNPQDPDCGHISQNWLPSQSSGQSNRSKSFNAIPFSWNSEFSNV
ncbi:hypothetical protein AAC387_Pa07g3721 [Persea americana]